jgi:hypothetical protein
MKKNLLRIALACAAAAAAACGRQPSPAPKGATLPDPVTMDPRRFSVQMDNDYVRVVVFNGEAGAKVGAHHLENCVAFSQSGCKLRLYSAADQSRDVPFPSGKAVWLPSELRALEVIGTKPCRLSLVELKVQSGR